jgi:hypothetical protein
MLFIAFFGTKVQAYEYKMVGGIGWDFTGGDIVASGPDLNCGSGTQRANNGLAISIGGAILAGSYETQASIGYKYDNPSLENGKITWAAIPLEVIQFYRPSNIRVGLGLIYQLNPKLTVDVTGTKYSNNFDNSLGALAIIGWAPQDRSFTVDLRYSFISYKQNNPAYPHEANGNVLGIYTGIYF